MINNLIEEIKEELRGNLNFYTRFNNYKILYEVLALKYLCDNNILNYDEIMKMDDLSNLNLDDENLNFKCTVNYKKLLHEIQYENLEEIIKEYINNNNVNILNNSNKKKLFYFETLSDSEFYYDLNGNTTYLYKISYENSKYLIFKLFDNVLNIKNDYKKINEIDYSKYDELHYYVISYLFNNNLYDEISNFVNHGLKVIYYTYYRFISNYKRGNLINLKNVIFLPNNKSILIYDKKDNDEISLINYNNEDDYEKLNKIINNNRKVKDVLVKVTNTDIRKNNYRLGFRLYQLEYEIKNKTINELVDQNSRLIARLERINEEVEREVNILINK